jgi:ferritin-like metal-binding protein YciE
MANQNVSIESLRNLFDYDIEKFISAEIQLRKKMPSFIESSTSLKLKSALLRYSDFIQKHIDILNEFVEKEQMPLLEFSNVIMSAFLEDMDDKILNCKNGYVKDACIISCIQVINHYKISVYGSAAAFSNSLGLEEFATTFHSAEVNEKQIDDRLSQMAEFEINAQAKVRLVYP